MQLNLFKVNQKSLDSRESTKVCAKCDEELPVSAFSPANGATYPRSECRKCARGLSKVRNYLRSVTEPPKKDHVCPICLKSAKDVEGMGNKNNGSWVLDHDHISEEARGWICHNCNRGIGAFSDNTSSLERAVSYLKDHNERS